MKREGGEEEERKRDGGKKRLNEQDSRVERIVHHLVKQALVCQAPASKMVVPC